MSQRGDLAREICRVGRRLDALRFVAATDGNLSCRLSPDRILCTPTRMNKGELRPADLCVVDLAGRQVSGRRRHTSELRLHLELYRSRPELQAVVHSHPPHVTAFAVTRQAVPLGILPEVEVFLGRVPIVPYETPGTAEFARLIRPHAAGACIAVLKNHGAVAWGDTLEEACWSTETLDAYCRILLLARDLGKIDRIPVQKRRELAAIRRRLHERQGAR